MKATILSNRVTGKRVARIEFDKEDEDKVRKMLIKGGFNLDVRYFNW